MPDWFKKALIVGVIVLVLLPVLPKLMPKPASFERARAAFEAAGYEVSGYTVEQTGELEAVEHADMYVDDAEVGIYRYDSEGKIAKQVQYQQQGPGSAMAESMNLRVKFGAAPNPNKPFRAARNGKYMIVVTCADKQVINDLIGIFKSL